MHITHFFIIYLYFDEDVWKQKKLHIQSLYKPPTPIFKCLVQTLFHTLCVVWVFAPLATRGHMEFSSKNWSIVVHGKKEVWLMGIIRTSTYWL